MALHLTKVAFGCTSLDQLEERFRARIDAGESIRPTTRYLPKRHEEIAGQGSLFWIIRHQLVVRSPILGFGEAEGGRVSIELEPRLILVRPQPKRAHQGWRYLEGSEAPQDLGGDSAHALEQLPPGLMTELSAVGLI